MHWQATLCVCVTGRGIRPYKLYIFQIVLIGPRAVLIITCVPAYHMYTDVCILACNLHCRVQSGFALVLHR